MPTVDTFVANKTTSCLATGVSGAGKSTLFAWAPQPIAMLLFDKDAPACPPGVDGSGIYYKTYPPAEVELSKDSYKRARNVADAIIDDIQAIKNHFTKATPLKIKQFDGTVEEWPTPATVVVEGASTISQHFLNRVLTIHNKTRVEEFDNRYMAYDLRLQALTDLYDMFLRFPCNKALSTWPNDETKSEKVNGKLESFKTGIVRPSLGGKLDAEGPGKFDSSIYCYSDQGKFYIRTRNNAKFQGFKLGGRYDAKEIIEVTIDPKNPVNLWSLLFGGGK